MPGRGVADWLTRNKPERRNADAPSNGNSSRVDRQNLLISEQISEKNGIGQLLELKARRLGINLLVEKITLSFPLIH